MIKILGLKRVITLAVLFAANVALAALLYVVLVPAEGSARTDLGRTRSAITARRAEVQRLKTEYQAIQEQKTKFGDLGQAGFFSMQDRVQARKFIEAIQAKSHVLSAKYSINAVEVKNNPIAAVSGHVLLQSPVTVTVDALDDIDIYSFIYWLENAFPGAATIKDVTINRKADIDEAALKEIGNGIPSVLVTANIDFSWNTFVAKADLPPQLMKPAGR